MLRKLAGNAFVLAHLPGQRSIAFAPRRRIEALRDARIARMARFAARTVPFYRDAFRRLGLDPRDIRGAGDLARLPIIDKSDVRRDPRSFVSESSFGRGAVPFVSSGSSGEPATFYHDARSLLANIAYGERERQVFAGIVGRELGYREATIGYPNGTMDKVRAFTAQWSLLPRPQRLTLSVLSPLGENIEQLERFRPDILFGFGSYLSALARLVAAGDVRLPPLRLIIYSAESVSAEHRREIEQTLGAPLVSIYSAVECFKIAFLCGAGAGFHVHEDLCHVRIVDRGGNDLAAGESGHVVISNLVNRGTVLLNYRLGDMAAFATDPCPCGRTLRPLADVDGRVEDLLELPDGRLLHARGIWGAIKTKPEVLQYQLVEQRPGDFVLRLVTRDDDGFRAVAPALESELAALIGNGSRVTAERHIRLLAETSGKLRLVVALPRAETSLAPVDP